MIAFSEERDDTHQRSKAGQWTFQDVFEAMAFGHIRPERFKLYREQNPLFDRWVKAKARAVRRRAEGAV